MITPLVGNLYVIKHTSGMIRARFIHEIYHANPYGNRRSTTHYLFQNLKTGRDIIIKSRVKIKSLVTAGVPETATVEILGRMHFVTIYDGKNTIARYTLFSLEAAQKKCDQYNVQIMKISKL